MVLKYNQFYNLLKMKEKKLKTETPHDRLKVLREHLKKTQAEFYAITGVTITTQSTPGDLSRKTIEKVLATTGVNEEWFVDGIGEMKITPVAKVESNTGFWKDEAYTKLEQQVAFLQGLVTQLASGKGGNVNFLRVLKDSAAVVSFLEISALRTKAA